MNKYRQIFLFLLLALAQAVVAQSGITVKSCVELTNDLDARVNYPVMDQNGHKCALLKVVTTEGGFTFDNGQLGVTKSEHKPELSEWWVYLPEKTMKIKIMHPVLGQLNDCPDGYFYFETPLKEATCYRMELTTQRKVVTYEQERIKTGFLIINTTPEGGQVYLTENGVEEFAGTTPFQKKLPYGTYNYRIKKPLYHDEAGIAVVDNTRVVQEIPLNPAFGSLSVTTTPPGATVTLENDPRTFTTPCTIEQLPSGKYKVNIVAPRYASVASEVVINDGQTTPLASTLDARFARVSITSLPEATIAINGAVKGKGSYSDDLSEGIYDIEVSLAHHRSVTKQIEVVAKQPQSVTIEPTPIYGSLDVITQPMYATVTINGKSYGDSPLSIEQLLVGDYDVVMSKAGYASVTRQVTITENQHSSVEATLPHGRELTIRSGAAGDEVFVDGTRMGVTPLSVSLSFGSHTIELRRGGKSATKEVDITTTGTEREIVMGFGLQPKWSSRATESQKRVLGDLVANMVRVEGGTFTMGATSEQGSDADSDENPTHQVTLSDYYIGRYEVTQAQWEAVMGNNPSYYKNNGSNCPVENVSWNDCRDFIERLNSLAGMNFRLPTEAEWEYAARGGNKSKGYKYSGSNSIGDVAWYYNSSNETHPVGTKLPNELGLYDMSGNVWEWCSDWYGNYSSSSQTNPTGTTSGSYRVGRGGGWRSNAQYCRVSLRYGDDPDNRDRYLGLRLAL